MTSTEPAPPVLPPPQLDGTAVAAYLTGRLPGFDPQDFRWEPLAGGGSNPTFLLHSGEHELVLRHGPIGHGLATAHDMSREYRVMAALGPTDVPAPRAILLCDDASVIGAPFYLMSKVEGVVLAGKPPVQPIPEGYATTLEERRRIGIGLIDALVRLHAANFEAIGLGNLGRPASYVARQVKRWTDEWNTWRVEPDPAMDELLRRLARAIPESTDASIVHGDYRLGNVILDPHDPGRVAAILDWELATLGDPMADLGYTMIFWGEPTDTDLRFDAMDLSRVTTGEGFLKREDLVHEYARRSGRDVGAVDFFEMLARCKLATFEERGYARWRQAVEAGLQPEDPSRLRRGTRPHVKQALVVGDASPNPLLRA